MEQDNYAIEVQVERLVHFLNAVLPRGRRFHIVGASMGGFIAGVFTAKHPDM